MTGYVRKDTTNNIADGNVINAADLDAEFDGVQDAFNASTGHKHDGTAGEGATINALGPTQDVTISSTLLAPKTTNTVDIGSSSLKFKDLFLAGNASVGGTLAVTGVATLTAQPILSSLTASRAVFTDGSKGLVSNAITGTGNVVMSASPTLTGTAGFENITASGTLGVTGVATFTAQPIVSSLTASRAVFSDGSKGLVSNAITGTGNVVMSASPTLTGTITAEALTASSSVTLSGGTANGVAYLNGSKVLTSGSALTFDGTSLDLTTVGAKLNFATTGSATRNYVGGSADGYSLEMVTQRGASQPLTYKQDYAVGHAWSIAGSGAMTLTLTGLGIGTSSPASKLHVGVVGGGVIARFAHTGETNNPYAYFKTNEAGNLASLGSYSSGGNSALGFLTADTERMRLDSAGNVGIGTSSPSVKLDVNGTNGIGRFNSSDANGAYVTFANNGTAKGYIGSAIQIVTSGSANDFAIQAVNNFVFATGGAAERMRIDSSGNLFVGTTSQITNEKLSIDTGNTVGIGIKTTGGASNSPIFSWNATTSGDGFFAAFATETSLTVRGSITYNRTAGLTSYNTTSDYRAKDIYGPIPNSGALIDSIPVYMGKMKGATQERPMFIAHETPVYAHTGVKDAVDADGNPVYQQMDASALIPVMWAEIQSLRQRLSAANL